ncbi:hypothetical protein M422DRAFT_259397 [Sphaerobolus stellatus SS14]|uniref:Peptidase S53 activation domain-containing protein n=1 Tax=Sphaerobolus stellatus (strain SS14) TaxID=990650 RepID=A0A0C9U4Y2_SPHS4|nr:hypothetical protein M422DRAFT_259397 [Sphaerobolus stellatus SS14]
MVYKQRMEMLIIFLLSAILAPGIVFAAPHQFSVHEQRNVAPKGFIYSGPAENSTRLTLRMVLKSNDLAGLEEVLYNVSDPNSPRWRQFLTKEEVNTHSMHVYRKKFIQAFFSLGSHLRCT